MRNGCPNDSACSIQPKAGTSAKSGAGFARLGRCVPCNCKVQPSAAAIKRVNPGSCNQVGNAVTVRRTSGQARLAEAMLSA